MTRLAGEVGQREKGQEVSEVKHMLDYLLKCSIGHLVITGLVGEGCFLGSQVNFVFLSGLKHMGRITFPLEVVAHGRS